MASQIPDRINQKTFPMLEPRPAPGLGMIVRPNGHRANRPMRNDAIPNRITMTVMHHRRPTTTQARNIHSPDRTSHSRLSKKRMAPRSVVEDGTLSRNEGLASVPSPRGSRSRRSFLLVEGYPGLDAVPTPGFTPAQWATVS